jgi:hypothetical protein
VSRKVGRCGCLCNSPNRRPFARDTSAVRAVHRLPWHSQRRSFHEVGSRSKLILAASVLVMARYLNGALFEWRVI